MKEDFLHFIWKYGLFDLQNLSTSAGQQLMITRRGTHNLHSGPDFSEACLILDGQTWAGQVEIHLQSSDWYRHHHQLDPAYDNVILHVVWQHVGEVCRREGTVLPTLVLRDLVNPSLAENYLQMQQSLQAIPCQAHRPGSFEKEMAQALSQALSDRLNTKAEKILALAAATKNDWQTVFYLVLSRYLGFRVNTDAMEMLARITPHHLLVKMGDDLAQVEALLFGQAGMLHGKAKDAYHGHLIAEYKYLSKKLTLKPLEPQIWKFMRMRPANFPTIRIAHLAGIVAQGGHLFSRFLHAVSAEEMVALLRVSASAYWDSHYRFGEPSPDAPKHLGKQASEGILINAVVPTLFAYGKYQNHEAYQSNALDLLTKLSPEHNRVTREWKGLGLPNANAYESQALLGLRHGYCESRRCMDCAIGMRIISG
jgi:hypothetical protein